MLYSLWTRAPSFTFLNLPAERLSRQRQRQGSILSVRVCLIRRPQLLCSPATHADGTAMQRYTIRRGNERGGIPPLGRAWAESGESAGRVEVAAPLHAFPMPVRLTELLNSTPNPPSQSCFQAGSQEQRQCPSSGADRAGDRDLSSNSLLHSPHGNPMFHFRMSPDSREGGTARARDIASPRIHGDATGAAAPDPGCWARHIQAREPQRCTAPLCLRLPRL
ncbi:uncharacterized protein B0T15DRAFT_108749 [Chaetomium strumarium]|uniref:Uncharacterized protein n=1 Tax=Chaetomium strumarium TaxID=1170767 RepID=A0AAJ0GYK0_9PEZI|nr:hypothetical protein B0T15DRAFT_108749 [Chaetomium strumarium]